MNSLGTRSRTLDIFNKGHGRVMEEDVEMFQCSREVPQEDIMQMMVRVCLVMSMSPCAKYSLQMYLTYVKTVPTPKN